MAKTIGTYDLSILPYEDCCTLFVPKSPTTNPNLGIVERVEANVPDLHDMIEKAVAGTETLVIKPDAEVRRKHDEDTVIQDKWF
ncbi:putative tRNA sulfurtransferase [compost metagenome]